MGKPITAFDRLDEVRSAARARAVEDFEFFCSGVLGFKIDGELALEIQNSILHGQDEVLDVLQHGLRAAQAIQLERAVIAWQVVLGRRGDIVHGPSETFEWLFPEVARRAA